MKDDKLYLLHISESLDRIDRYVSEGEEQFMKDTKTQDAVLRNLQVMAESTQRLSSELKLAHPEVVYEGGEFKPLREVDLHEGTKAFVVLKAGRITNVARIYRINSEPGCDVRVRRGEAMIVVDASIFIDLLFEYDHTLGLVLKRG